jgi:hypothetical protein
MGVDRTASPARSKKHGLWVGRWRFVYGLAFRNPAILCGMNVRSVVGLVQLPVPPVRGMIAFCRTFGSRGIQVPGKSYICKRRVSSFGVLALVPLLITICLLE